MRAVIAKAIFAAALIWAGGPVLAAVGADRTDARSIPPQLEGAGIDQKIGSNIPLDLEFLDEHGRSVQLRDYFGTRPVVLAPVYYECPMLCQMVIEGMVRSLRVIDFGSTEVQEFEVIAYSFAVGETPEQALAKKQHAMANLNRPETEGQWHFLTGNQASVEALSEAIGFRFDWDEKVGQYIHAASLVVLTPDGQVSRYLYGIDYAPRDLRLALVEASQNRLGGVVDQVLLYCFSYNPMAGRYTAMTMNILRLAAIVTVVTLGSFIALMWRRDRRRSIATEAHA